MEAENALMLADKNRRLQELVAELLRKNETLRSQLAYTLESAGEETFHAERAAS